MVFDDGVQLLHHHQLVHFGGKVPDELHGQGVGHAQLQHGDGVAEDLLHILIGGGGGDDAHLGAAHLYAIDGGGLRPLLQLAGALLQKGVAADGVARHHDIFGEVLLIGDAGPLFPHSQLHQGLGVGHPGTHLQQHRGVELLRQVVGQLGKLQGLGGVRGLQHGDLGGDGVVAGVLLVLRGVHPRVVSHADDHAAVHAGVGHGEQGVGGHVQAHMLHAAEGPLSRQAGAEGHLHGHLLVGGPLAVDFGELHGLLGDLGAGGAGIAGDHAASRLIQPTGNGGVAQHQLFHILLPAFCLFRFALFKCFLFSGPGPPGG